MEFFGSEQARVPLLAASKANKNLGSVSTSFAEGAILVQNDQNQVFRLSWKELKEDYRYLAPGNYVVRGYRIVRKGPNGDTWHTSATRPKIKSFTVTAGESVNVPIDSRIVWNQGFTASNGTAQVSMAIFGENKSGLSIYRNGKRIPISFELHSNGKVVASGAMNYG